MRIDGGRFHLAQANVARMRAPLDDPLMAGFVALLASVNAAADRSPGFVWRLQTEAGDATAIRAFEDERILFNMSVWESIDALHRYAYQGEHLVPLRARRDWFEPMEAPTVVLWWVAEGHQPTVDEARLRFDLLRRRGPHAAAFTFRQPFPPPGGTAAEPPETEADVRTPSPRPPGPPRPAPPANR